MRAALSIYSLPFLGMTAQCQGDFATARAAFEEALALISVEVDKQNLRVLFFWLEWEEGNLSAAQAHLQEGISSAQERQQYRELQQFMEPAASIYAQNGHLLLAAKLLGVARQHQAGRERFLFQNRRSEALEICLQKALGAETLQASLAEGMALGDAANDLLFQIVQK
jgi:tetratricopeptide (TPR) repeat protein